ncbi:MAG: hypothetical protein FWC94_00035 [Bacteroidales bacterium]|nr:hypothetical protein [Bacteroidales bacterium]
MKKKTNKLVQLILLLLMIQSTANLQAQLRVGGNVAPNPSAVLDLNANDTVIGSRGLLLPRVTLISTTNTAPLMEHIAGMLVFNTATSNDVSPGVYVNDGTRWIRGLEEGSSQPSTSSVREIHVNINEVIGTQSVLYHGVITNLCPTSTILDIRGVFSDPLVAKTSFVVTPVLKPNDDGTSTVWSIQVQNFNFDPQVSCVLEKIVIIYNCSGNETPSVSFLGSFTLVGW